MRVLEFVWGLIEQVAEFLMWRDEWKRTWNPVSFWLAVFTFLGLVLVAALWGYHAWEHLHPVASGGK